MRTIERGLTVERLREVLNYDQGTGDFTWRVTRGSRAPAGKKAGNRNSVGYVTIWVDGRHYLAHRLAFLWMTGEWPSNTIDHKNRRSDDNRWCNLRPATQTQNNANTRARRDAKLGIKGVSFVPKINKSRPYSACICVNRRRIYLGYFDTAEAASSAYKQAADRHFGEFAGA